MRQVIEGKVYDTETAERIHQWGNGHNAGDFHRCQEALYRTSRGAYFLAGEGGALSPWSVPVGNNGRGGGSGIRPLTEEEARTWLEEHEADAETIEAHFTVEEA
ncbi:MAG: hypothetical protein Q8N53_09870 [Longimicrobiales bacterium]|nr:hypothetical protein [Longimicrobiales bacterium]